VEERIHFLHILSFLKKKTLQILQFQSFRKVWNFLSEIFKVFFYLCQKVGQDWASRGVWPFLLGGGSGGVEAWGKGGAGWQRGTSQLILLCGPLSPPHVLLPAVAAVTVLTVQPCAV